MKRKTANAVCLGGRQFYNQQSNIKFDLALLFQTNALLFSLFLIVIIKMQLQNKIRRNVYGTILITP